MLKISTSMFSTIDKIFHNHHFIKTDYTPNANMADLSVGPGLVARKWG